MTSNKYKINLTSINPQLLQNYAMTELLESVLHEKLYIAQNINTSSLNPEYQVFRTFGKLYYYPFCDDFGPMDMAQVTNFITMLTHELRTQQKSKIVYVVEEGRRALTNAGMLVLRIRFKQGLY